MCDHWRACRRATQSTSPPPPSDLRAAARQCRPWACSWQGACERSQRVQRRPVGHLRNSVRCRVAHACGAAQLRCASTSRCAQHAACSGGPQQLQRGCCASRCSSHNCHSRCRWQLRHCGQKGTRLPLAPVLSCSANMLHCARLHRTSSHQRLC